MTWTQQTCKQHELAATLNALHAQGMDLEDVYQLPPAPGEHEGTFLVLCQSGDAPEDAPHELRPTSTLTWDGDTLLAVHPLTGVQQVVALTPVPDRVAAPVYSGPLASTPYGGVPAAPPVAVPPSGPGAPSVHEPVEAAEDTLARSVDPDVTQEDTAEDVPDPVVVPVPPAPSVPRRGDELEV